ncbi:MAG: sugar phosphate isomerase/epimerase family protein [Niabella sp.]
MTETKQIGLQLWSLKTAMQEDANATITRVAKEGYNFVELAGHDAGAGTFHGLQPDVISKRIQNTGMQIKSVHCNINPFNAVQVCEQAVATGTQYIVLSFLTNEQRQSVETYKQAAEDFNKIGAVAKTYNLQFCFHNHAQEFETKQGLIPYEILLAETDSHLVNFQMDIGWTVFANQQPEQYFKKHPGRFPLWHLRDFDAQTGYTTAVGKGVVDFARIFNEEKTAGFKLGIVELSSHDTVNAWNNIQNSYQYLHKAPFG